MLRLVFARDRLTDQGKTGSGTMFLPFLNSNCANKTKYRMHTRGSPTKMAVVAFLDAETFGIVSGLTYVDRRQEPMGRWPMGLDLPGDRNRWGFDPRESNEV